MTSIGKQAIVVGAGISGLTAARALADYFEKVIVLERDRLPTQALSRTGTPQDKHLHALLVGGLKALGELFPGFEQDLAGSGGVPVNFGLEFLVERPGVALPKRDLGLVAYTMSRPLLEYVIRERTKRLPNVEIRDGVRVVGLVPAADAASITAVQYNSDNGRAETLPADLVIDASGRGAPTLSVLQAIGSPLPSESIVGVDRGYSTGFFAISEDARADWKAIFTFPDAPKSSRRALLIQLEGSRWMVSASGRLDERPPADWDGVLAFLRDLRTPTIYNTVKNAERLGEIMRFNFPESVWRHFDRLETFPRGLLPVGDAVCRFNPVHGQGMTVAAQEACLLQRLLGEVSRQRDPLTLLRLRFLTEIQPVIEAPWIMSAVSDFIFPGTRGDRPADYERALQFGAALERLSVRDAAIHKLTAEVQNLLKPRSAYVDPEIARRIEEEMSRCKEMDERYG